MTAHENQEYMPTQHNSTDINEVCPNGCYLHWKILNRAAANGIFIVKSYYLFNRERIEHVL